MQDPNCDASFRDFDCFFETNSGVRYFEEQSKILQAWGLTDNETNSQRIPIRWTY